MHKIALAFVLTCAVGAALLALTNVAIAAKQVCRDAKTGQFVSASYAKKYPGLTTCEIKTDVVKQKKQG
jgi:hypothetical protein